MNAKYCGQMAGEKWANGTKSDAVSFIEANCTASEKNLALAYAKVHFTQSAKWMPGKLNG